MAQPNDAPNWPPGTSIAAGPTGTWLPSAALVRLLVAARNGYDWPAGTGAAASQERIIRLEKATRWRMAALNPANAHKIVVRVSRWAGNNSRSHRELLAAMPADRAAMRAAINNLAAPGTMSAGLDALCELRGLSLVIASKIFRFCCPHVGAAVDRHASYFFNSLPVTGGGFATHFARQWSNQRHSSSRLSIYTAGGYAQNRDEYVQIYLPLLAGIARQLNASGNLYLCAATGLLKGWTAADVEMAAYYWWACNGAR